MAVKRILEFNMQIFGVRLIYGGEEQFRIPLEQTICTEINLLPRIESGAQKKESRGRLKI